MLSKRRAGQRGALETRKQVEPADEKKAPIIFSWTTIFSDLFSLQSLSTAAQASRPVPITPCSSEKLITCVARGGPQGDE